VSPARALIGMAVWLLTTAPAFAQAAGQTLAQGGGAPIAWWRVFGATVLCLLLGVAGVLAVKARRDGVPPTLAMLDLRALTRLRTQPSEPRRLQVVETVRLAHQVEVSLLTLDDAQVLIASSPHGAFVVTPGAGVGRKPRA